ncbi:MAG: hypothetical protein ACPGSL_02680 [Vicingaceae bacterium]
MIKHFIKIVTVTSLVLTSCKNDKKNNINKKENTTEKEIQKNFKMLDIPFSIAKNYFVKNDVENIDNPKIETAEKFNAVFGMTTTMDEDGKPTEIDFSKQYIIAIIKPETDLSTAIEPKSLQRNEKGEIVLTYKCITEKKQSYTTCPNFAIIVDKSENGNILLNEIK